MIDPAQVLPWDSEFFGTRIARVVVRSDGDPDVSAAVRWCDANGVCCAYLLLPAQSAPAIAAAQRLGFRMVDVRVTVNATATPRPAWVEAPVTRLFDPSDLAVLRRIARRAFEDTRFFRDGRFARERCEALYDTWIQRDCATGGAAVVVQGPIGAPLGFVTCALHGADEGQIGLIAVSEESHGRGVGASLVLGAVDWFMGRGVRSVSIVTQGSNIPAVRTYERCGFKLSKSEIWLHRWRDENPDPV